jgi:uncharacterized protein (DUF1501 family)
VKAAKLSGAVQAAADSGRILLVVELQGGCDGLNTVIPFQSDAYYASRPSLGIRREQGIHTLDDSQGLHPAMTGLKELWDSGHLSVVQGVGYPNPNCSHFRSRDIWHTAAPEDPVGGGWLSRYLGQLEGDENLQALNIGGNVPKALTSEEGTAPSIQSIDIYQLQTDPRYARVDGANKNSAFQRILSEPQNQFRFQEFVTKIALDATYSSSQILEGRENYNSTVEYPDNAFAENLRTVAQIIAADLGITIFYTSLSGFDTHSGQVVAGNSLAGNHSVLLDYFSQGIKAFYDDLVEMEREEDVLIMSFSEFGRRLSENGSLGTDHGTANQMFVIGDPAGGGFFGEAPGLSPGELDEVGDMVHSIDFRSVYASVLQDWLGADAAEILGEPWDDPALQGVIG